MSHAQTRIALSALCCFALVLSLGTGCGVDRHNAVAPTGMGTSPTLASGELNAGTVGPDGATFADGTAVLVIPAGVVPAGTWVSLSSQMVNGHEVCEITSSAKASGEMTFSMAKPSGVQLGATFHLFRWDAGTGSWVNLGGAEQGGRILGRTVQFGRLEVDEQL
jgi:hypothetical protein